MSAAVPPAAGAGGPVAPKVTLYTRPGCHLCEDALRVLRAVAREVPCALEVRDITTDERLHRAYFERIPVVTLDGEEVFEYFVDGVELRARLAERGP